MHECKLFSKRNRCQINMLSLIFRGQFSHTNSTLLIGKVVSGIDDYLIGIA